MSRPPLTDVAVRALKPPSGGTIELWDGKFPGFGVRMSAKGTKAFVLLYRIKGRPRRLTLGRYPMLSLTEARRAAQLALAQVATGVDPAVRRQSPATTANLFAFETFAATFIERYAKPKNRDWRETERLISREFVPHLAAQDVREITRAEILAVIDAIVLRGSTGSAIHALAAVRRLFNWAVERGVVEHSPIQGLKPPGRIKSRDRVLSDFELAAVWQIADRIGYPFGPIVQLLILTGQRRGEVTGMRWSDIDLAAGLWSITSERNKSGRPHEVPLTRSCVDILRAQPRAHEILVFPANRHETENPVSGHGKAKHRIETMSGVTGWTLHDLRRTTATGMAKLKVPPHVIERVLNHASGSFAGVAGIYNRFGYLDEMRTALEAWECHLTTLSPTSGIATFATSGKTTSTRAPTC